MNDQTDDARLKAAFRHLREQEDSAAPSFVRVLARARAAGKGSAAVTWPRRSIAAGLATVLILGAAFLLRAPRGSLAGELPVLLAPDPGRTSLFAGIDPLTSDSFMPFYLTIDLF